MVGGADVSLGTEISAGIGFAGTEGTPLTKDLKSF